MSTDQDDAGYVRRLVGTGGAFLLFGGGALIFAVSVQLFRLLERDPHARRRRVREMLAALLGFFVRTIERWKLIRVRLEGLDRIDPAVGSILVCNHPTLIDAPVLLSQFPSAACLVKSALAERWKYRTIIRELGYLPVGTSQYLFRDCEALLREGRSLLVFPEGTRSSELSMFARGPAVIALRSRAPIVPISIRCSPPSLGKGERWYQIPNSTIDFAVTVHYPFRAEGLVDPNLSEREQSLQLTGYLERILQQDPRSASDPISPGIGLYHRSNLRA